MTWSIYGEELSNRLLIGSALYPSPEIMSKAVQASGSQVITLSLKRQNPSEQSGAQIWQHIQNMGFKVIA